MLSRFFRVGTTLVVLGLLSTSAFAQGGGRGGPGGGGPGGGRGMGGTRGTAADLMGLLAAPEVRKEVKLSDEGWAAVEKIQKESQEAMMAMFRNAGGGGGRDASDADREKARAERDKMMKERSDKAQAVLDEVLPPEGLERLLGLYVQLRGDSSITGELPSKKLNLSDADKEKIQEAVNKAREAAGGFGGFGGRGGPGGGNAGGEVDREAMMKQMRERMAEMQKKSDEAVQGVLTDAQKKAVADLKGAKFEFPESVRTMGGFGGGFGGPGGPGGQGAPGGQQRRTRPGADTGT